MVCVTALALNAQAGTLDWGYGIPVGTDDGSLSYFEGNFQTSVLVLLISWDDSTVTDIEASLTAGVFFGDWVLDSHTVDTPDPDKNYLLWVPPFYTTPDTPFFPNVSDEGYASHTANLGFVLVHYLTEQARTMLFDIHEGYNGESIAWQYVMVRDVPTGQGGVNFAFYNSKDPVHIFNAGFVAVPEPLTTGLALAGVALLIAQRRRKS